LDPWLLVIGDDRNRCAIHQTQDQSRAPADH
jgi:hypothetical protein